MLNAGIEEERRTSVDIVFDHLYDEIKSLRLLPGVKISEAEIAGLFGVSRQPVRDAFSRLENLDLLLIRPQKATEVKRFSSKAITTARFVRAALEAEVLRRAARNCDDAGAQILKGQLSKQRVASEREDYALFRALDYDFHKSLCSIAQVDFAFERIANEKAKIDRLCVLELSGNQRIKTLFEDHENIAKAIQDGDEAGAVKVGMLHLSRLDSTIEAIRKEHADYFID